MPFITKNAAQIRTDMLRDIKNLLQLPDDKLGPDSDWYVRASSVASVAEGLYQHQGWIVRQIFPDTADAEFLYLHARLRGLTKKKPPIMPPGPPPLPANQEQLLLRGLFSNATAFHGQPPKT